MLFKNGSKEIRTVIRKYTYAALDTLGMPLGIFLDVHIGRRAGFWWDKLCFGCEQDSDN